MAKTKAEKITSIEEEIRQLENRRRQLVQEQKAQERKDRTKRLCRRMGLFESLVPETIPLTEEQFKTFLEKTVMTDHARRILDGLTAQNAQIAREIEIALPRELTREQGISLVREYVKRHFVAAGMCADVCLHDTGGGNPPRPYHADNATF